jgi:DNA-binding PadR family transcriptional regulator
MITKSQGYILSALCYGPFHGYAVAKKAVALGDDNFTLAPSSVYLSLRNLVHLGLAHKPTPGKFAITSIGLTVLAETVRDQEHFVQVGKDAMQAALNTALRD